MTSFQSMSLPERPSGAAPDGSDVRALLNLKRGGMAHFEIAPGQVSRAVAHRTVEEIWYVLSGRGEMWRSADGAEEFLSLESGVCLTIPLGTRFQFRSIGDEPLQVIGITMPPWPGTEEAYEVHGPWTSTLPREP